MTMDIKGRKIAAGEFKARCLAILDEVAERGAEFVVTKRGKPVARVVPLQRAKNNLAGSIVREKDIVSPLDDGWEADR
jgi:prevent-host-death family protein